MTPEVWRATLISATLLGFSLTAGNVVLGFMGLRRQISLEHRRMADARRLSHEEQVELARWPSRSGEMSNAIHFDFERRYAEVGLVRPSYDNMVDMPGLESLRLVTLFLDSSRSNLIWAGIGLVVTTAATVIALAVL